MRILIADFSINQYGGIIENVTAKAKAIKSLGHIVDIAQLSNTSTSQKAYDKKIKELESGEFQSKLKINSQNGGHELDSVTGYWKNNYYGFYLPPSNKIGVFENDALERWKKLVSNFDLIIWNFMPTKSSAWGTKDFSFWWKFFDLPKNEIRQIFVVHDAYFDIRASNVSALKEKIMFLECAHIAAYRCCENIEIPRALFLNPRFLEDEKKMFLKMKDKRKTDFFAAHIFKSMKHMDDIIRAVPYLKEQYSVKIAGCGIEQMYMVAPVKIKSNYLCDKKKDPDLPKDEEGMTIWNRAEKYGMEYLGQISSVEVLELLRNSKFAVDPSWSNHYSQYCRTHINGFIIEAMLNGCYPVLRDYRGLNNSKDIYDPLFESIKAVYIPWDATPKQFAKILKNSLENISSNQFLKDTLHNYKIVNEFFNAKKNMEGIIRLVSGGDRIIKKELEIGEDSPTVKKVTKEIMTDFYNIKLPIKWES